MKKIMLMLAATLTMATSAFAGPTIVIQSDPVISHRAPPPPPPPVYHHHKVNKHKHPPPFCDQKRHPKSHGHKPSCINRAPPPRMHHMPPPRPHHMPPPPHHRPDNHYDYRR